MRHFRANCKVNGQSIGEVWNPSMHEITGKISIAFEGEFAPWNSAWADCRTAFRDGVAVDLECYFNGFEVSGMFIVEDFSMMLPSASQRPGVGILTTRFGFESVGKKWKETLPDNPRGSAQDNEAIYMDETSAREA